MIIDSIILIMQIPWLRCNIINNYMKTILIDRTHLEYLNQGLVLAKTHHDNSIEVLFGD